MSLELIYENVVRGKQNITKPRINLFEKSVEPPQRRLLTVTISVQNGSTYQKMMTANVVSVDEQDGHMVIDAASDGREVKINIDTDNDQASVHIIDRNNLPAYQINNAKVVGSVDSQHIDLVKVEHV